MTTRLNPYLSFAGDASAALAFYLDVFGGDLTINHFGDFGTDDHGIGDQVMHGQLETASGLTLMAADMLPGETLRPGNNLAVSLRGDDTEELRGYWQALSDGGTVTVELATQPWGDEFGMCVDRFGTSWLVNIAGAADLPDPLRPVGQAVRRYRRSAMPRPAAVALRSNLVTGRSAQRSTTRRRPRRLQS